MIVAAGLASGRRAARGLGNRHDRARLQLAIDDQRRLEGLARIARGHDRLVAIAHRVQEAGNLTLEDATAAEDPILCLDLGYGIFPVRLFGRPAKTNPLLAKLARRYDCPVHGARAVRLPNGRFRLEITDEIDLPRDASGHIDVEGATALVTEVIEGWIREHPEQWLWVHRRWEI